jgi:hypothetical protein
MAYEVEAFVTDLHVFNIGTAQQRLGETCHNELKPNVWKNL